MIELRLRTRTAPEHIRTITGKALGPADYDVLLTGPARVLKPDGQPLAVYLPGAIADHATHDATYQVLHSLKTATTGNRGLASGTRRLPRGPADTPAARSDSVQIASAIIGSVDPLGQQRYCRLTAWTGRNLPAWRTLHPLLRTIGEKFAEHVPARHAAQMAEIARTDPAWVVPGTPFTTVTVNNCVDRATECLTQEHGWTSYDRLAGGDHILAFDPETRATRWEPVLDVYIDRHHIGPMVELTSRGFSAATTPDHRWPVQPTLAARPGEPDRPISVRTTGDLPTSHYWSLLRSAPHEAPAAPVYDDAFVRLVAWYITEGTLMRAGTSIGICQSDTANPVHVDSIRRDLKQIGARPWTEWKGRACDGEPACPDPVVSRGKCNRHSCRERYRVRKAGITLPPYERTGRSRRIGLWMNEYRRPDMPEMVQWVLTGDQVTQFLDVAPGKAKVPTMKFLSALTAEQLRMFVDTCIAGDGSPEFRKFYQHHVGRMDAYMAAAALAGWAPTLDSTGTMCFLRQSRGAHASARISLSVVKRRQVTSDGLVWCPRVPSGHWVARRAGTVYITGNSYPTGVHKDKGDLEAGFSSIACLRRGDYTGGQLVFPEYRIAADLRDGDLILMDAHEWHGNVPLTCGCGNSLRGPCDTCGAERISIVSYMRTRVADCGSPEDEADKAAAVAERRSRTG